MKKIYAGAVALLCLVSVTHSQTIRPEFPFTNGPVRAIMRYGNAIYIGGSFTSVIYPSGATYARQNLAAFDAATGTLLPWNPGMSGGNNSAYVEVLTQKNNTIYVGGDFSSIAGQPRSNIAALDPVTGMATSWHPALNGTARVIVATDSRVYVSGYLSAETDNILVFDITTGQRIANFNPRVNGTVSAMGLKDNNLYIGGGFTEVGSKPRYYIAAIDATNGTLLPWNPAANYYVTDLKLTGNTLYASGWLSGFGYDPTTGSTATRIKAVAALDAATGAVHSWDPHVDGVIDAVNVLGNNVYLGGLFGSVGGEKRFYVAMVNAITGIPSPWDPKADDVVYKMLADTGTVYVSGNFRSIGGQQRSFFAALVGPPTTPVVTCPANVTVSNEAGKCGRTVNLNATAHAFPDFILSYRIGDTSILNSSYYFPLGVTTVTASASNIAGESNCTFTVTVNDTEPPSIASLSTSTSQLWPANKKMRDVWIDYTATDNCTGPVSTQLSIGSNEPITAADWKIIDNHHIQLKADRLGKGSGRIYTINVTAKDRYGNSSSRNVTVSVPHDQSGSVNLRSQESSFPQTSGFLVRAESNPSRNYFVLLVLSDNTAQKANLRLFDANGHLLETKSNVAVGQSVQMGRSLANGFYIVECTQGTTTKQLKLIKQ